MTCETCEFGSNKSCCAENSKKNYQNITECDDWGASLEYYSEIIDNAPWYIKGLKNSSAVKNELSKINTYEELEKILKDYEQFLDTL